MIKYLYLLATLVLVISCTVPTSRKAREEDSTQYTSVFYGISPDRRFAIACHQDFKVYLFDALSGRKIGRLEEIDDAIGPCDFIAKWSSDSQCATIFYRVSRHDPIITKSMTYRIERGRAIPLGKPLEASAELERLYFKTLNSETWRGKVFDAND